MEYVNFYPKTFNEIEKQDNSTYGPDECLMITKEDGGERSLIIYIAPNEKPEEKETVTRVALFWNLNMAEIFCKTFEKKG